MTTPRVLILTGSGDGSSLWRVWQPAAELERQGYIVHWAPKDADNDALIARIAAYRYNVIVLARVTWPVTDLDKADGFISMLHALGMTVIYECDDDMFLHVQDHLTDLVDQQRLESAQMAIHTVKRVDGITVSTPRLQTVVEYVTEGKIPVAYVPNLLDVDWWQMIQRQARRIVPPVAIGWAGAKRQDADLAPMAEAWRRVAAKYPQTRFVVQGWCPDVVREAVPADRLTLFPFAALNLYPAGLVNVDIGCCSVADTPFNACKCVVGGTLVSTEYGLQTIKTLVQHLIPGIIIPRNMRVLTTGGWAMSTYGYAGGEQDTIRITTKRGFSIEGTLDHKLRRADDSWARMDALAIGDEVRLFPVEFSKHYVELPVNAWAVRSRHVTDLFAESLPKVRIDENWGRLLGYLVGDGFIGKNHVRVTCDAQDQDVVEDVARMFTSIGLTPSTIKTSGGRKCVDVSASSARFNEFLWSLGVHQEGRKSFAIPDAVLQSPKSVIAAFLQGLFEADGTVEARGSGMHYVTKSLRLAQEVLLVLTGFGIVANLTTTFNKVYQKNYYRVSLARDATDQYAKEIGFRGKRKQDKLAAITAKPHSNAFRPQRWADAIVAIERGRKEVFDLSVPGPTEYIANGFVSHNSVIKALEYGASGAAVVATSALYHSVIRHNDTGLIANTADEWTAALSHLVEDRAYADILARRLKRRVLRDHNLQRHAHRWIDAWAWLLNQQQRRAA